MSAFWGYIHDGSAKLKLIESSVVGVWWKCWKDQTGTELTVAIAFLEVWNTVLWLRRVLSIAHAQKATHTGRKTAKIISGGKWSNKYSITHLQLFFRLWWQLGQYILFLWDCVWLPGLPALFRYSVHKMHYVQIMLL